MAFALEQWLARQAKAALSAAHPQSLWPSFAVEFPRLVRAGLPLPPAVVLDLLYLHRAGDRAQFPDRPPQSPDKAWRDWLSAGGTDGQSAVHRGLIRAHVLRSLQGPKSAEPVPGARAFLDLVAPLLPAVGDRELWASVGAGWSAETAAIALNRLGSATADMDLASAFYAEFARHRPQLKGEHKWLALASARDAASPANLDMVLLQSCAEYQPLRADDATLARLPSSAIRPREKRRTRVPTFDVQGISTKGRLSNVLRSILARPDFCERYVRNELLYLDMQAPVLEPRRVLLAWIVERDLVSMSRTSASMRRDTAAMRLAAYTMEDAMRRLLQFPVLEVDAVVMLHNGDSGHDLRGLAMAPKPDEKNGLPDPESAKDPAWVPGLAAFMPDFFVREPRWAGSGFFEPPDATRGPWERSLMALRHRAGACAGESDGGVYDLIHVSLLGSAAGMPSQERRAELARILAPVAVTSAIHSFMFGDSRITASPWPQLRDKSLRPPVDGSDYSLKGLNGMRRDCWNDLALRLLHL